MRQQQPPTTEKTKQNVTSCQLKLENNLKIIKNKHTITYQKVNTKGKSKINKLKPDTAND